MTPLKKGRFVFDPSSIKWIRDKLGLSQEELATQIGVAKTAISRWEKGQVTPDANSLAAIYSVAKEGRIEPTFFTAAEPKANKTRSRLFVSWDFQNLPVSLPYLSMIDFTSKFTDGSQIEKITNDLTKKFPDVSHSVFKVFTSSAHSGSYDELSKQDWRIMEYDHNIDEELDSQSWSDCNQNPKDTIFVLITKDGDYAELIEELRGKGVMAYLMAPENSSQRLLETVGKRWRIPYPQ